MRRETEQSYQERLRDVLRFIDAHLDDTLTLERLAQVACFSPFHFHRIFRGMVGESVKEHVRRLRLERAARRLGRGNVSVLHVALDAGYGSPEAFCRAFESMFGVPPSAYRQSRAACGNDRRVSGTPQVEVRVKTLDAARVAYVRYVGPFDGVGRGWGELCAWAGPRDLLGPQARFLACWLDDPEVTSADRLRADVCITIRKDAKPEGAVGVRDIPGGEYAVATHRGPYSRLEETYAGLCGVWAPDARREFCGWPGFEVYLNNPQTASPEELLTEIHMPLMAWQR